MKPRYSGPQSRYFWDQINKVKGPNLQLYSLGCSLQEIELNVFKRLKAAKKKGKKV